MHLSNVLAKSGPVTKNGSAIFLACYIEESYVTIALWQEEAGRAQVIDIGIPKEWQDSQSIIDAIELGIAEFSETEKFEKKMLFGLPETWVEHAELTVQYAKILQEVSEKLFLQPLGYVLNTEAVCQYIYKTNQASSAVLFLNILSSSLSFYLADDGQVKQRESVGRSDSFADDIHEALARITTRPLPTKIFFFSEQLQEEKLEEIKNEFLSFNWDETELFHHLPSIDILNREQLIEAVCIAGGAEAIRVYHQAKQPSLTPERQLKESTAASETEQPLKKDEEFDFVEVTQEVKEVGPVKAQAFSFGVPIPTTLVQAESADKEVDDDRELAIDQDQILPQVVQKKRPTFTLPSFGLFRKKKHIFNDTLPEFKKSNMQQRVIVIVVVLAVVLLASGAGAYAYLSSQSKAEVLVTLHTQAISSNITITLDPDVKSTDPEKNILKVNTVSKEVEGSDEIQTTGSKIIGEKATGVVTVFNKTQSIKTFSKGTSISGNGKSYVIEEDVTVASASSRTDNNQVVTLTPGKNDVKIVASGIGADFNLSKGTEFSIANFGKDTYLATNTDDLKGGSSREIQAVAKADQQKLSSTLLKSLKQDGEKQLKDSALDGEYIVVNGQVEVVDEEFSAKVGDETASLKLNMVVKVGGYSYKAEDLKPIAQQQLASQVPDGAALLEDKLGILSEENDATGSGRITLEATLNGQYSPPTNSDQWIDEIKGRTLEQAERILKGKKEIKEVKITLQPTLSRIVVGKMPADKKYIVLTKKVE